MLRYACILSGDYDDFPSHVVKTISELFGYEKVAMWPLYPFHSASDFSKIDFYIMNYVVYNIEDELLDSYQSKYYKYDIMQPLNLPQQFLGRKLITSSEITAVSPIRASGFGEFLAGNNADSLCTLYLSSSDAALATLAVSHKAGRGDFSFEEQRMLKQICEITSLHYQQAVRAQQKKVRNSLFELGVNTLCDSYIILNQDLQVMERSSEAEAYCKIFYEKYFITFSSSLSSRVSFAKKQ